MAKIYKYGIDISEHNGNINLAPYTKQFVIIRGGYSTTIDKKAKRNMDLCEKLNIPYGIYWYSYALTTTKAKQEAQTCLGLIKGRNIKVGVWFDMEDADGWKRRNGFPSSKTISDMCNTFCKTVAAAGFYAGVYASESWLVNTIKNVNYPKWVASWGSNNGKLQKYKSDLGVMHQYTSKPLDKDVIYVPLSTFAVMKSEIKPITKKTITEVAKEVIAGKWGTGKTREKRLTKAGYNYDKVQAKVNQILGVKKTKKKTNTQIAKEVIEGKWGNGETRVKKLKAAGYDPAAIQKIVNKLMK